MKQRTVEFLVNELLLDQQHATDLTFEAKRVGSSRGRNAATRNVKDEVLVVFESVRDRDDVWSYAKNLERRGRGLRLEVPDHLWPSFRVLQSIGYPPHIPARSLYLELTMSWPGLKLSKNPSPS